jgi:hypothetical protein
VVPDEIRTAYGRDEPFDAPRQRDELLGRERRAIAALAAGGTTLREVEVIYADHMRLMPEVPYPARLERFALAEYLRIDPARDDLRARLAVVESMVVADGPLLSRVPDPAQVDATAICMDGLEAALSARPAHAPGWLDTVAEAFRRYHDAGRADEFPASLECEALARMLGHVDHASQDRDIKLRLGKLLSRVTVQTPLRRK